MCTKSPMVPTAVRVRTAWETGSAEWLSWRTVTEPPSPPCGRANAGSAYAPRTSRFSAGSH